MEVKTENILSKILDSKITLCRSIKIERKKNIVFHNWCKFHYDGKCYVTDKSLIPNYYTCIIKDKI